jgi:hypothetical protein
MAIETDIMLALFARLRAFRCGGAAIPVAWPNRPFQPVVGQNHLRVMFVPNVSNRVIIGSRGPHQHLGLMQVDVFSPLNQGKEAMGDVAARSIAAAVADHFPCDLKLAAGASRVRITKRADVRDMIVGPTAIQIPVMISWECFG